MRYGSRLIVQLDLLEYNYREIKKHFPDQQVLFMVKADAYGHGLVPISRFAHLELGIKEFGTASLGEALKLREELPKEAFDIYVFSDIQVDLELHRDVYLNRRIIPVLTNFNDLEIILNSSDFKYFPLCLKFNTGMNRLGFFYDKVQEVIDLLKKKGRHEIEHLMTHYSSSSLSMSGNKRNTEQAQRFQEIKEMITQQGITIKKTSIANSGSIEQNSGHSETHIRPGLIMYGPSSLLPKMREDSLVQTKVISQLESYVIDVFPITKGTPIGYGATPCPDNGQIVIMALGYGDGFSTNYQNVQFEINGVMGKIVGRVNMDMSQVLVPSDLKIKRGDPIIVWNHERDSLARFCEQTNTIPYEVLCRITPRVPRIYQLK
ncbi:MAG: alanine racemase [Bdellovibrio sp. CG12_big_fil_rev_8_21_14_0_65_39_13]|nr:MAG: alanine racemase [Bdellovibrio sp. CG22_combo_CG10-13_8_21_14_all_39_27]PIQ59782.1 MAG: alanine racemase [Bdellovibrio sp. CG12_big_fil_rev_8_21_14_0_65_39_13]PIR36190.1 MAG: alanine racemase [Bdellovibrio sp. CG11_big_fil_rev_8_21_14_0_20_39_38]